MNKAESAGNHAAFQLPGATSTVAVRNVRFTSAPAVRCASTPVVSVLQLFMSADTATVRRKAVEPHGGRSRSLRQGDGPWFAIGFSLARLSRGSPFLSRAASRWATATSPLFTPTATMAATPCRSMPATTMAAATMAATPCRSMPADGVGYFGGAYRHGVYYRGHGGYYHGGYRHGVAYGGHWLH